MPYGLKITFLVHFIVAAIFGLVLLLIPDTYASLTAFPIQHPAVTGLTRLLGAAFLGFAASSWFAYKETLWERVKIVVQMEIIWAILGALAILWGLFFAGFPVGYWMNVAILLAFAIVFIIFYSRK